MHCYRLGHLLSTQIVDYQKFATFGSYFIHHAYWTGMWFPMAGEGVNRADLAKRILTMYVEDTIMTLLLIIMKNIQADKHLYLSWLNF